MNPDSLAAPFVPSEDLRRFHEYCERGKAAVEQARAIIRDQASALCDKNGQPTFAGRMMLGDTLHRNCPAELTEALCGCGLRPSHHVLERAYQQFLDAPETCRDNEYRKCRALMDAAENIDLGIVLHTALQKQDAATAAKCASRGVTTTGTGSLSPAFREIMCPDFKERLAGAVRRDDVALAGRIEQTPIRGEAGERLMCHYLEAWNVLTRPSLSTAAPYPRGLGVLMKAWEAGIPPGQPQKLREAMDMCREFAVKILLPSLMLRAGVVRPRQGGETEEGWIGVEGVEFRQDALRPLSEFALNNTLWQLAFTALARERGAEEFLALSDSWHQAHHRFPDRLQPLKVPDNARWHPLAQRTSHRVPQDVPGAGLEVCVLTSVRELAEESDGVAGQGGLNHCVGRSGYYASECLRGASHILSVRDAQGNRLSTAELNAEERVMQHKGYKNGAPPPEAQAALNWFMGELADASIARSNKRGDVDPPVGLPERLTFLRNIGFIPGWNAVDAALAHYQQTIAVKVNRAGPSQDSGRDVGGAWRKELLRSHRDEKGFFMRPLVSGARFVPESPGADTGRTVFLDHASTQEFLAATGLDRELDALAREAGLVAPRTRRPTFAASVCSQAQAPGRA